jgi:hypothetical protein
VEGVARKRILKRVGPVILRDFWEETAFSWSFDPDLQDDKEVASPVDGIEFWCRRNGDNLAIEGRAFGAVFLIWCEDLTIAPAAQKFNHTSVRDRELKGVVRNEKIAESNVQNYSSQIGRPEDSSSEPGSGEHPGSALWSKRPNTRTQL